MTAMSEQRTLISNTLKKGCIMRFITLLITCLFVTSTYADESFVSKGVIHSVTLAPDNILIIDLNNESGCKKERYHLKENADTNPLQIQFLLAAFHNKSIVNLHNSEGRNCEGSKVFFDIIKLQRF